MDTETKSHGTESLSLVDPPFKILILCQETFKYKIEVINFSTSKSEYKVSITKGRLKSKFSLRIC